MFQLTKNQLKTVYQCPALFTNNVPKFIINFMRIAPDIDLSQFYDEDGNFTAESSLRLNEFADGYFSALKENKPRINASVCILKGRINEKLQERRIGAYEAVVSIVNSEDYEEIQKYDLELHYFPTAVKIYQMERGGKEGNIFEQIEYIDDFKVIFCKLLFYFRRIQLKMSKQSTMECMKYIRAKKLSVFTVAQVLLDCDLGQKKDIFSVLSDFYLEQGGNKEALFLLNMAIENVQGEAPDILIKKRDDIKENI